MKRLWIAFALVMVLSFAVLGWIGVRIYQEMPPLPDQVVTTAGEVVIDTGDIPAGQNVWQSLGGMEVGSVWGHGSYVAPDWTADWLHREAVYILEHWSEDEFGQEYSELSREQQAQLQGRLEGVMRTNTYDSATQTITIDPLRAEARLHAGTHRRPRTMPTCFPAGGRITPVPPERSPTASGWSSWLRSSSGRRGRR